MRKNVLLFLLMVSIHLISMNGQILQPVKWTFSASDIGDNKILVKADATIEDGWHLYSAYINEGGPVATSFKVNISGPLTAVGRVIENPKPETIYDKTFEMDLAWFSHRASFTQEISYAGMYPDSISGEVFFMACDDETCLPPSDVQFMVKVDSTDLAHSSSSSESKSHWAIFLIAFGSGFLALLTPCVFPMIPMTVSFFTKQSKNRSQGIRNAFVYGAAIIVIYVLLGTVVTAFFGADALNALSTNPIFNIAFFLLLLIFAASFLGAFEIILPSSWINAADRGADKGGLIGIFFMAFTLALVSFSCTGPIVGTLIVQAAQEGGAAPVIGMLGFSLAIALPFFFFAAFPGYLNSLPKSGGWLNSVKVVLGFLELAFAFKFLSVADMVMDWHLLEREVFISIWIVVFGALGFYLLGKLRLPHDSPMDRLPVSRLFLGLLVLGFTVYLIPGLFGAPVKMISGFPPPKEYSESPYGVGFSNRTSVDRIKNSEEENVSGLHLGPQGLMVFHDYKEGLEHAKKSNKPMLLDFTGKGCVNCRKMEEKVWSDERVLNLLSNKYVLVSLYVDSRMELLEEDQYVSEVTGKKVKTVGNKWSDFQITRFKRNSQPHYVIMGFDDNVLVSERAYDLDVNEYVKWLDDGVDAFYSKYSNR